MAKWKSGINDKLVLVDSDQSAPGTWLVIGNDGPATIQNVVVNGSSKPGIEPGDCRAFYGRSVELQFKSANGKPSATGTIELG